MVQGHQKATSATGVISQHEVKDYPVLPDIVMLAFERKQVRCLTQELTGTYEKQIQVLNVMLDIFQKETKAQEAIQENVIDVLVFILRSRCEEVELKGLICDCLSLLCKYPNGRKAFVDDILKLEDLRHSVQDVSVKSIHLAVLEICLHLCHFPRGADALVTANYWSWILGTIDETKDAEIISKSFLVLSRLKTECNLDQSTTAVSKQLIKSLITNHFTRNHGSLYALRLLEFCIAITRLHHNKTEFINNMGIETCFKKFVDECFLSCDGDSADDKLTAKGIQFLGSLVIMVSGKNTFKDAQCSILFYDTRMYSNPILAKTVVQLILLVAEQPELRASLLGEPPTYGPVVRELRQMLQNKETLEPFVVKIVQKTLDLLFWMP